MPRFCKVLSFSQEHMRKLNHRKYYKKLSKREVVNLAFQGLNFNDLDDRLMQIKVNGCLFWIVLCLSSWPSIYIKATIFFLS